MSSALQNKLRECRDHLRDAYVAIADLGGTLPEEQDMSHLVEAIRSISDVGINASAKTTIIETFGQTDGEKIIAATNSYLANIAIFDKNKAILLTSFINEDPMMVCSLGLSVSGVTIPERWLISDGASWIDTGVEACGDTIIRAKCYAESRVLGCDAAFLSKQFRLSIGSSGARYGLSTYVAYNYGGQITELNLNKNNWYVNGVLLNSFTYQDYNVGYNIPLFTIARGGIADQPDDTAKFVYAEVYRKNGTKIYLVPCTNKNGMVDLENMEFFPNQGEGHFLETYTLPDGTPWTPPTH